MDNIYLTIFQSVGFPALCVIAMAYYVKYITDQHREELQHLNDQHRKEMIDLTEALNNNTLAMQKLTDYIMYGGKDNAEGN